MAVLTYGNGPTRPLFYPDRARMALDWKSNRYLGGPSQITRAGSALMLGPDGYQSFAAGELARIDGIGAQVAPARVNLLPWSNDLTQIAGWAGTAVTRTANAGIGPDGTQTASRLEATSSDSNIAGVFPVTVGTTYALSVWLRSLSGPTIVNIYYNGGGLLIPKACALTAEWQRFELQGTPTTTATTSRLQIGGTSTLSTGKIIEVWGAQAEAGSYASPPIITSGAAVSRPGDILSASVPDGGRAFVFEWEHFGGSGYLLNWRGDAASTGRYTLEVSSSSSLQLLATYGGSVQGSMSIPTGGVPSGIVYGVLSPGIIRAAMVGRSEPDGLSINASPVNLNLIGFGGAGDFTSSNTFIHAHRFTERPVTDFATPADAFAWAKSIAQGWAS
jgi:hypothetical protein